MILFLVKITCENLRCSACVCVLKAVCTKQYNLWDIGASTKHFDLLFTLKLQFQFRCETKTFFGIRYIQTIVQQKGAGEIIPEKKIFLGIMLLHSDGKSVNSSM